MKLETAEYTNEILLTSDNVYKIITDCLFDRSEVQEEDGIPDDAVLVEGVMLKTGFHPDRLEDHRSHVKDMLLQLPDQFFEFTGGGWSFLNMVQRKNNSQWGEQKDADALLALGLALDLIKPLMPKETWKMFPGSMPYITIKDI